MGKILLLLPFLVFSSVWSKELKLDVPECVREIVENYAKDYTSEMGFPRLGNTFSNIDKSIKMNEIEVEPPIKEYIIDYEILDTCSTSLPINELIRPTGRWVFPVKARNQYIYQVYIRYTKNGCIYSESSSMHKDWFWTSLRKQFSVKSGINPVLVINGQQMYLHFPHKGSRNLYYLDRANFSGDVANHDFQKNSDGKDLIASMQKRYHDGKPMRDEIEKTRPGIFKKMREFGGHE